MNSNWQPIKFLIEVITLQILIIGMAVSLATAIF